MEKKEIIELIHQICEVSFHDDLVLQINKKICEEIDKQWEEIKEDKDVQM